MYKFTIEYLTKDRDGFTTKDIRVAKVFGETKEKAMAKVKEVDNAFCSIQSISFEEMTNDA